MFYYTLFSLLFVFLNQTLHAYVSEAERWQHSDSENVVYLLYDIHNLPDSTAHEDRDIHYRHREQILHFLKASNSSLIVEDSSVLIDETLSFANLYGYFDRDSTAMYCIDPFVSREKILSTSVEFRPDTIKPQAMVSIAEVVEASENQVKEMQGYQDGELLDTYYRKNSQLYRDMLSKCNRLFQRIADQNEGIETSSYRKIVCPEEAVNVLRKYYPDGLLERFDSSEKIDMIVTYHNTHLLDAAILHALSKHLKQGKQSTVIFAGRGHLRRITPILTKMGYRLHESYVEPYGSKRLFDIKRALQTIEPSYDPNKPLPKTAVDYFLTYKRWEADHPTLKKFVPAYTIAVWYDYYQAWKQEESAVKKAAPIAIAGTVLAVVCALIKLCSH